MKEDVSGCKVIIDYEHHKIHKGQLFECSVSDTIGAAGTLSLSLQTPNTNKHSHCVFSVSSSDSGVALLAEGDVITGGTIKSSYNKNRNSANLYSGTFKKDATRSTPGTELRSENVGSNDNPTSFGA